MSDYYYVCTSSGRRIGYYVSTAEMIRDFAATYEQLELVKSELAALKERYEGPMADYKAQYLKGYTHPTKKDRYVRNTRRHS
jgi:hypothetical protein